MEAIDFDTEGFTDLIEAEQLNEESIPLYGIRVLVFMDSSGQTWLQWATSGAPEINDIVAMMSRVSFLSQLELSGNVINQGGDEDDENE